MTTEIGVPAELADALGRFLAAESIDLAGVTGGSPPVTIVQSGPERQDSEIATLYAGGRISCEVGRAMAKRLGIDPINIGKLADHLDIKIHGCVLGCFR